MEKFKQFELITPEKVYGGMLTVHNTCWDDNGTERSDTFDDETGTVVYD